MPIAVDPITGKHEHASMERDHWTLLPLQHHMIDGHDDALPKEAAPRTRVLTSLAPLASLHEQEHPEHWGD